MQTSELRQRLATVTEVASELLAVATQYIQGSYYEKWFDEIDDMLTENRTYLDDQPRTSPDNR